MYGWRGRIGLMLPYDNAVIEPEFARTLPPGVSAHVVRTTKTDRMELAEESLLLAPTMKHLRANIALYACNASSFIQGRAWHDAFLERFQAAAGVRTESANSAMIKLMTHRKIERVAVVSPYPKYLLEPLARFITDFRLRGCEHRRSWAGTARHQRARARAFLPICQGSRRGDRRRYTHCCDQFPHARGSRISGAGVA